MEGRVRQQELAASGSWFICPLTIIITTTHRRPWETRRGSHRLPVELGFLENGTVMVTFTLSVEMNSESELFSVATLLD